MLRKYCSSHLHCLINSNHSQGLRNQDQSLSNRRWVQDHILYPLSHKYNIHTGQAQVDQSQIQFRFEVDNIRYGHIPLHFGCVDR